MCGEQVLVSAKKCKHCGEIIDVSLRVAEEARRAAERNSNNPMVFMNAGGAAASSAAANNGGWDERRPIRGEKSKVVAGILAVFLGGIGIHKFYLGQGFQGFLYLVFCWTFIPAILGLIDGISYLCMSDRGFAQRYG
jgi:hypothetical protein